LRFENDEGTEYIRREEIRGPLDVQLERTVALLDAQLGRELVVLGVRRYELARVPEVVLRESVANALAHRSYEAQGTPVRIELRPSVVRVVSPGGLPEPVTQANIREQTAPRNLDVIKVLRRYDLAEDAGRGVDVMQDTMRFEMLEPPEFLDHLRSVEVILPVRSPVAPVERAWVRELELRGQLQGADRLVLVYAARGEGLTNSRTRELLGVDAGEARVILQRLRDRELLVQHGERGELRTRCRAICALPRASSCRRSSSTTWWSGSQTMVRSPTRTYGTRPASTVSRAWESWTALLAAGASSAGASAEARGMNGDRDGLVLVLQPPAAHA